MAMHRLRLRLVCADNYLLKKKKKLKFPDMTEFWASMPELSTDSTQFISEDRDGRCF
jgi:hypothetical protein